MADAEVFLRFSEEVVSSDAYAAQIKDAEQNTEEFQKRVKKLVERSKTVAKTFGAYVEALSVFVTELADVGMMEMQYKRGDDPFVGNLGMLVGCLQEISQLQRSHEGQLVTRMTEPLENMYRTTFKDFDASKKAFRKAMKTYQSARSSQEKQKADVTSQERLSVRKAADAAIIDLKKKTVEHLQCINTVDARKEMVMVESLRQYVSDVSKHYESANDVLQPHKQAVKDLASRAIERRFNLNNGDSNAFKQDLAQVNAFKRQLLMDTHEFEKDLRANEDMTDLERVLLMQPPGPLSPFATEKVGWIYKKAGKRMINKWDKRFAVLKDGKFRLYRSLQAMIAEPSTDLDVMVANVKPMAPGESNRPHVFQIVGIERTYFLQAEDDEQMNEWLTVIQNATAKALASAESKSSAAAKNQSVHPLKEDLLATDDVEEMLFALWDTPGNEVCVDCFAARPQWVSINLGALICIECSGHHRNLGVHISKVRSFRLDDWDRAVADYLLHVGNDKLNSIYEANEARVQRYKPKDESNAMMRDSFIKKKYIQKALVLQPDDSSPFVLGSQLFNAAVNGSVLNILSALAGGANIDWASPDAEEATPLHVAVAYGHVLAATCLVLNSANVNCVDAHQQTPLHVAAMAGHFEILKFLLKNDASPELLNVDGQTPLDLARIHGHHQCIDFLVRIDAPGSQEYADLDTAAEPAPTPAPKSLPSPIALADDPLPPPPPGAAPSAAATTTTTTTTTTAPHPSGTGGAPARKALPKPPKRPKRPPRPVSTIVSPTGSLKIAGGASDKGPPPDLPPRRHRSQSQPGAPTNDE